jgi:hypothetical protein
MKSVLNYIAIGFIFLGTGSAEAIVVNDSPTPAQLINNLLGSGVTVFNVTFAGTDESAGTFSDGEAAIGINNGIILSTGNVNYVVGPNRVSNVRQFNGLPGDTDLDSLIPGYTTKDATVLEFDFVVSPVPGKDLTAVSFEYVFASDEYNEFVGDDYNDVFGFFVNGINIALLPETTIPVSINNVNSSSNSSFYINNEDGSLDTEMDGLTVVLTAEFEVVPGEVNHMKLAVGDAVDEAIDSNVFLKKGSFTIVDQKKICLPPILYLLRKSS